MAAARASSAGGLSARAAHLRFGPRYGAIALAASVTTALLIGIPTDVVPNPWFTRMTPVRTLDVALLSVTSLLLGALLATYSGSHHASEQPMKAGFASGMLGWLAIGCPVCNKVVVLLLGSSGALQYFSPLQPILGGGSVVLAALALRLRLRRRSIGGTCAVPRPR